MIGDVGVIVEHLSKKFCRDLKRSLWYGIQGIGSEFIPPFRHNKLLRKDEFWALNDISFELRRGECLGIIGPNGSGKSTLLKILNGLNKPDMGRVTIRGRVGALIELGTGFSPVLTGRENLYINATILGLSKHEIDGLFDEIVAFAEIGDFIDMPLQNYSSGMKVRLGFAVAANLRPDILIIDEVLAVGDVGFRMKCYKHLRQLLDDGTSVIFVSHSVNHLSRITERVIVLNHGRNVHDGDLAKGIGIYEHLVLRESKSSRTNEREIRDTPSIGSVSLLNNLGRKTSEFQTGETLIAEIELKTPMKVVGGRLRCFIETPAAGIIGSFATPFKNFQFDLNSPSTSIKLFMPNLPLLIGGYYFNLSLHGPDITDVYHRKAPAAEFQITGPITPRFGFGLGGIISFEHQWELMPKV